MSTAAITVKGSSGVSTLSQQGCCSKSPVEYARELVVLKRAFAELQKEMRPIGSTVSAGTDVITDFSYFVRLIPELGVLDSTLGLSTGVNAFLGLDGVKRALARASEAAKVGSAEGERTALLDAARCVVQVVGGATYFGVRGLTLATQLKGVDATSATAPTLLGRVTFIVAAVGSAIWGLFYIFLAVVCGRDIRSAARLRTELIEACKLSKTPEEMSSDELLAYVRFFEKHAGVEIPEIIATDAELIEEAIQHRIELVKTVVGKPLSGREYREIVCEMIKLEPVVDLVAEGAAVRQEKHKAKCRLELTNLVGARSAKELIRMTQNSMSGGELLSQRIERGDSEADEAARLFVRSNEELTAEMETSLNTSIRINAGYMGACLIGIAATTAGFFALSPVGLIVVTVAFFLMVITMSVLDGYRFHKALDAIDPGQYDKTMLTISTVIGALSAAGGIAVVSFLSMGIVPLIAAIVIAGVWIGVNAKVWHAVCQHEAKAVRVIAPNEQRQLNAKLRDLILGEFQEDPRKIGISEKDLLTCHVEEITPDMLAELEYTG